MQELAFPAMAEGGPSSFMYVPKNSLMDQVVAISRNLAKSQINWTVEERKLFGMVLTKIKWREEGNPNIVELNKREIIESLGLKIRVDDQSVYLRKAFQKLARDSEVHWTDPEDRQRWLDAPLILSRASERGKIYVEINRYFMPHLEALTHDKSFITMFSTDLYHFTSRFSFALFDELRIHYDSRHIRNTRSYTTKQLKTIFALKKNDYVRKNGKFNRSEFERKTLDVAIKEINAGMMMTIFPVSNFESGGAMRFYRKLYENGKVKAYEFTYIVKTKVFEYSPGSGEEEQ